MDWQISTRVGQTFNPVSFDPTTYTQCAYQSAALGLGETKGFECERSILGRFVTVHFPTAITEVLTPSEVADTRTQLCYKTIGFLVFS